MDSEEKYKAEKERALISMRRLMHRFENISNAKRKKAEKEPINSFPKLFFKLPKKYDIMHYKTFVVYDELEKLKKMSPHEFLLYLFKNMLIYHCNLIFNNNFFLEYNYNRVEISVSDFRQFFPRLKIAEIKDCERKENTLYFDFDLDYLGSLNKEYCKRYLEQEKSRQYIVITLNVVFEAFKTLGYQCKPFLIFIISLYHYKRLPKIMHNLKNFLGVAGISLHEGKKKALDRLNKYMLFLAKYNVVDRRAYNNYEFKIKDFENTAPLNIKLARFDHFYMKA